MSDSFLADVDSMVASGYDPSIIEAAKARNSMMQQFLESPLGDHLQSVVARDGEEASGGNLLGAEAIKEEIHQQSSFGPIFPFGFLPVWTSGGGNAIVYALAQKTFYWAGHESFSAGDGTVLLPETYDEVPLTEKNIRKALVKISTAPPAEFLKKLRAGQYEEKLEELD